MLVDFYALKNGHIDRDALFSASPGSTYWFTNGVSRTAVKAIVPATLIAVATNFLPGDLKNFSLFIGGLIAAGLYRVLSSRAATSAAPATARDLAD